MLTHGGFHERAASVKGFFLAGRRLRSFADLREAPRRPSVFLFLERFFLLLRKVFLPPADSPCFHSHSLWSLRSGASWSPSSSKRGCYLRTELDIFISGNARSAAMSQSSEPGDGFTKTLTTYLKLPVSNNSLPGCCAAGRILLRPPTNDVAARPACAPPPP